MPVPAVELVPAGVVTVGIDRDSLGSRGALAVIVVALTTLTSWRGAATEAAPLLRR